MKTYAFICTRSKELSEVTSKLVSYLSRAAVDVKLIINQDSIFSGYQKALEVTNPDDEDTIIMCHDDIEFLDPPEVFTGNLLATQIPEIGFIGVAGTTHLKEDAVWWNKDMWKAGKHRGFIKHIDKITENPYDTNYGPPGQVVVLDGVFLAAKAKVLRKVGLEKPSYFEGDWDFYDIHYTSKALKKKYINHVVPISLIHHSSGDVNGRDSWHKNREAFIKKNRLPLIC